jgi:hypothetical protein
MAIADALEGYDEGAEMPLPDLGDRDGWRFVSQPVAVRTVEGGVQIERVRQAVSPDLVRSTEPDAIVLAHLTVELLEEEGRAAGLEPLGGAPGAGHRGARRLRGGAAACLSSCCASARSIRTS